MRLPKSKVVQNKEIKEKEGKVWATGGTLLARISVKTIKMEQMVILRAAAKVKLKNQESQVKTQEVALLSSRQTSQLI